MKDNMSKLNISSGGLGVTKYAWSITWTMIPRRYQQG